MRTRLLLFPPLLVLMFCGIATAQPDSSATSLVQPAFAFSEKFATDQTAVILPASDNVPLYSVVQGPETEADGGDELETGSFTNVPFDSVKPLRSKKNAQTPPLASNAAPKLSVAPPLPVVPQIPSAPTPIEESDSDIQPSYPTAPYHSSAYLPSACECSTCETSEPSPCECGSCGVSSRFGNCGCEMFGSSRFQTGCFGHRRSGGSQFFMDAWISAGATLPSRSSRFETEAVGRFPDTYDKFLMNQLYFTIGRSVNKRGNSIDIGGRLDLLYGSDYYFTSALGLETKTVDPRGDVIWDLDPKKAAANWNSSDGSRNAGHAALYGLSMPQLYGEFFVPLGLGTTVKAGHFYSMMGYESAMSPENFFYSHTLTMTHGEPTTFTGVVVNQQLTQRLTGIIGYTSGWDVWENPRGTGSVITGFKWNNNDRTTELAFTVHTGNAHAETHSPYRDGERTNYSLVYSRQFAPRWRWVIQHDLGFENHVNEAIDNRDLNNPQRHYVDGRWASLTNYLYYTINKKWSIGGRFEWFQDTHGSRIAPVFPYEKLVPRPGFSSWTTGQNYYNMTLGLNWKPRHFITLRPEVRWDWSDVERYLYDQSVGMYRGFSSKSLFTVGLEGYIKF